VVVTRTSSAMMIVIGAFLLIERLAGNDRAASAQGEHMENQTQQNGYFHAGATGAIARAER
jgi:hypothetical protein